MMLRKAKRISVLAGLLLVACSGGRKSEGDAAAPATEPPALPIVITRLEVEDATPAQFRVTEFAADGLLTLIKQRLTAAGLAFSEKAPENAVRLTLEARLAQGLTAGEGFVPPTERAPGTHTRAVWVFEGKLKVPGTTGGQHLFLEGTDEGPLDADPAAALRRHVDKALDPVVQGLLARTAVVSLSPNALIKKLGDPDPKVRWAVVDQLGLLRAVAAVEPLGERAKVEQDREVLLRLIGALAEIGDDRAAQTLIGLANPRDREMLRAILEALSVVGGERVTDFLDILASHDAPDVREMVEDARNRLGKKSP